jgi:hypothetical protein
MPTQTILILSANPKGTTPLRLDEEVREIKAGLKQSKYRERFQVEQAEAVTPRAVQDAMLEYRPQIVHFCGHGEGEEGIVLEGAEGRPQLVSAEALADLFGLFAEQVSCVVLNACYSEVQARAIAQHVGAVIGMNRAIGDRAAIEYAVSFYKALGAGEEITFAHKLGCNAIKLMGIDEALTPVLLSGTVGVAAAAQRGDGPVEEPRKLVPIAPMQRRRLFISYKRDAEPDERVAQQLEQALGGGHEVAIDRQMTVGADWMAWIDTQLRQSDFLVVLLSEVSVHSEMVQLELEKARQLVQQQGRPQILPVRLAYRQPFQYPLSQYLNPLNWAIWQDDQDTAGLIAELERAMAGEGLSLNSEARKAAVVQVSAPAAGLPPPQPMAQPRPLELPEGTMDLESQFYVERDSDRIALETMQRQGVTITIKGPRQMGKSSLLNRLMQAARQAGKRVVFLDFQLFDAETLQEGDRFFQEFCSWLSQELDLEDQVAQYWQRPVSDGQRCTRYVGRHVLPQVGGPLVLAMDEVESIFDTPFRSGFFSMLRSWHNSRAMQPLWKQLDLALVTSTEPYQLIADLNQSPFNVGQVVELVDFSSEQVHDLNQRHGLPFNPDQEWRLMQLVNGHPYLVRRALYLVASGQMPVAELLARAAEDRGPFGDHLRYHLFRMYDKPELVRGYLQVLQGPTQLDEQVFFRLRGAGLVGRRGQQVVPRCQLYAAYFQEHLHG